MVTITDIAREAGVSPQVVSKVLNGGKGTASAKPEIRKRIKEVADKLGYRPFAAGQMLRKGSFRSIGILIGNSRDYLVSQETLAGISSCLAEKDYTATLFYAKGSSDADILDSRLIRSHMTDGLLMTYVRIPSKGLMTELTSLNRPVLWLNARSRYDSVSMNEADAAGQLVMHLCERGARRIAFIDYSRGGKDEHTRERIRGARNAAQMAGADLSVIVATIPRAERATAASEWLKKNVRTEALIINSLTAAQIFLQVAMAQGRKVPEDLALVSFDSGNQHKASVPFITCALRPDHAFGRVAAEMMLKRVENPGTPIPHKRVPFELFIGGTS